MDADDAAVGGRGEPAVVHLAEFAVDDSRRCLMSSQGRGDFRADPGWRGGGRRERHQHGQQCLLVDQEDQLPRPPGQGGRVPVAEQGGGRLVVMGHGRARRWRSFLVARTISTAPTCLSGRRSLRCSSGQLFR